MIVDNLAPFEHDGSVHRRIDRVERIPPSADLDDAGTIYRDPLAFGKTLLRVESMANQYEQLGNNLYESGDLDGAEQMYRKALAIDEELGHLEGIAIQYANLGVLIEQRGDLAEARRLWTLSRDTYAKLNAKLMAQEMQNLLDSLPPQ